VVVHIKRTILKGRDIVNLKNVESLKLKSVVVHNY